MEAASIEGKRGSTFDPTAIYAIEGVDCCVDGDDVDDDEWRNLVTRIEIANGEVLSLTDIWRVAVFSRDDDDDANISVVYSLVFPEDVNLPWLILKPSLSFLLTKLEVLISATSGE